MTNTIATTAAPFRRRKAVSWLALSVLLFNLVGGLFLPASMASAATGPNGDATGLSNMVVCTPHGLRVIALDVDGVPLPEQSSHAAFCAFCLPLTATALTVPTSPVVSATPTAVTVRLAPLARTDASVAGVSVRFHAPRAPPTFA